MTKKLKQAIDTLEAAFSCDYNGWGLCPGCLRQVGEAIYTIKGEKAKSGEEWGK